MENSQIIIKENKGVKYLQFKKLLEYEPKLTHAFYIGKELNFRPRKNGIPQPQNFENYRIFANALNLDGNKIVRASQNHSNNVKIVEEKYLKDNPDLNLEVYENVDGLITTKKDIILGATAADCNLILIYDPVKNVIANVHAGWRGVLGEIIIKAINKLKEEYNSNPQDIICAFCPSIRKHHFEVDFDVYEKFLTKNSNSQYYEKKGEKYLIDLVGLLKEDLIKMGIKNENIIDSDICSYCNEEIHSCRRDKETFGLSLAIITLNK